MEKIKQMKIERNMNKYAIQIATYLNNLLEYQIHPTKRNMATIQVILNEAVRRINLIYGLVGEELLSVENAHTLQRLHMRRFDTDF